jgi:Amt family ammonium transporter
LRQLGVDYAQGYHLGRPQPLESLGNAHVMLR